MSLLASFARAIGIAGDATSAVERTREALAAAERERSDAAKRLEQATAALSEAEQVYDADGSDALGDRVIKARNERDLASLKADRARRREEDARRALVVASHEAKMVSVEEAFEEALGREETARRAEHEARTSTAAALTGVLTVASDRDRQAHAALVDAAAKLQACRAALLSFEAPPAELDPERASELQARRAGHKAQVGAALAARLSVDAVKREIAPEVEIIVVAERLIEDARARIAEAVDRQRAEAARAQAEGFDVAPVHEGHKVAHLELARCLALPAERCEQHKLWEKITNAFALGYETWVPFGYTCAGGPYSTFDELLAFVLDSPVPQASTWRALIHSRAVAAGDVNAINWERAKDPAPQAHEPDDDD